MGLTYANIQLQNNADVEFFRRGKMGEDEIRQIDIHALVFHCDERSNQILWVYKLKMPTT